MRKMFCTYVWQKSMIQEYPESINLLFMKTNMFSIVVHKCVQIYECNLGFMCEKKREKQKQNGNESTTIFSIVDLNSVVYFFY